MKLKISKFILVVATLFVGFSAFAAAPQRIVSLKPNITEILFAIGAGDQVVGVTTWCDRPARAKDLPKVADYIEPNIEKIIALKPDLIIASEENSVRRPIDKLASLGIAVALLPFKNVDDITSSIKILGQKTGHIAEAARLTDSISEEIKAIKTRGATRARALVVVGRKPLIVAAPSTFLGELLDIAGGRNIIQSTMPYPHINIETVIAKNPDVIIDLSMGSENKDTVEVLDFWRDLPIEAVKNRRVYALNISDFRAGPEIGKQLKKLNELLNK